MKFPQIGELLTNGHIVDAAYCAGEDRYVLAHRDGAPEPYAVWSVDQNGDTRTGKYFTDPTRAQRHFANCCYDWTYDPQPTEKAANSFTDTETQRPNAIQNIAVTIKIDEFWDMLIHPQKIHDALKRLEKDLADTNQTM